MSKLIENFLFVNTYFSEKNISPEIFILCNRTKNIIESEFFNKTIPEELLEKILKYLIIYKTSNQILNNINHKNNVVIIKKEILSQFNFFDYNLDNYDYFQIIPILNIQFTALQQYIDEISKVDIPANLSIQYNKIQLCSYFGDKYKFTNIPSYWEKVNNITFNNNFCKRNFKIDINRLDLDEQNYKIIQNVFKTSIQSNYLNEMNYKQYNNYTNTISKYYSYNHDKPLYSQNEFDQFFINLKDSEKLQLLYNFLVNKDYCYMVFKYKYLELFNKLNTFYNVDVNIISYYLGYAWLTLYLDESLFAKNTKTSDTFVIDIDSASLLKIFPYTDLCYNPYLPLLINTKYYNINNYYGLCDYGNDNNLGNKGITNLVGFKYRFNIFCSDNPDFDIFKDFDFDKYKLGISGSAITACIQHKHPLMSIVSGHSETEKFINYFDEYYDNSDIDLMFLGDNDNFYNGSNELLKIITTNLQSIYNNITINMELITTYSVFIGFNFINSIINEINIDDNEFNKNKLSFIKKNIKSEKIISVFKPYFEKLIVEDKKFVANHKIINLYLKTNIDNGINVEISYKYKIISNKLKRSLEIFPIKGKDHFSVISSFHLPNVRGYYNGSNVYLLPSCISAHLTYTNLDYKYFAGSKDPIKILEKNRRRGFGTILSNREIAIYIKYCNRYNISTKLIFKDITDDIFKPKLEHNLYYYNLNLDIIKQYHQTARTNIDKEPIINKTAMNLTGTIKLFVPQKFNF
jgi:hypothetical protein